MKILTFAATNSRQSINAELVRHATSVATSEFAPDADVELIDLNDYEMPIFSVDRQQEAGIPSLAQDFFDKIGAADAVIVSFAEHNGSYTVAFKNVLDWASRIDSKIWQGKPLLMLATSPGPGGGRNVLVTATGAAPFWGGDLRGSMFVPNFGASFDREAGELTDPALRTALGDVVASLFAAAEVDAAA